MSEDTPDDSKTGSTAADATHTEKIPQIDSVAATLKKKAAKKSTNTSSTKNSSAKKSPTTVDASRKADETGDAGSSTPEAPDDASSDKAMSDKADAQPTGETKKSSTPPLTAGEYARTTKPSPSTTAVIPAVRDDSRKVPEPKVTVEPAPRNATLTLAQVDPWSVTRLSFAVSVALMVVSVVAVSIFWIVLNAAGVWDQINDAVTKVLSDNPSSFDITEYLGFGRLVGLTLVLSAINVVLMTALATIAAHLYNLAAQLLGGVEVTFTDER